MSNYPTQSIVDASNPDDVIYAESKPGISAGTAQWSIYKIMKLLDGQVSHKKYPIGPDGRPTSAPIFKYDDVQSLRFSFDPDVEVTSLISVSIVSNNIIPETATIGDTVIITIVGNEPLDNISGILGGSISSSMFNASGVNQYDLLFTLTEENTVGFENNILEFSLTYGDIYGNMFATPVTLTTDSSTITYYTI